MPPLALIVDDEPGILLTLAGVLEDQGYRTVATRSGLAALEIYQRDKPDLVFLDVWLPDRDGLETLQALRAQDPTAAVVMMSGHGTTSTAVKAIKMGAFEYLEKPLSYAQAVEAAAGALRQRQSPLATAAGLTSLAAERELKPAPALPQLVVSDIPQRTIQHSTVIYGLGLHSGGRTGMVIQPLPPNSGLHLISLPSGTHIPMHLGSVGDTEYATTLGNDGSEVKTVEHFLSALHAYGISNLLVKVHGELPVLDGSAADFCRTLEQIGIEDQAAPRQELVIDRHYEVSSGKDKILSIDPPDDGEGFSVSYLLRYPPPIGEQFYEFKLTDSEAYKREIAPARTFGFMRDLKMMAELGLGSGGRLDNFILVGEDDVVNTELRFTDEFVRHKILDIIGDLYLIGYPIRGKVTARLTGHRDNIALLRAIANGAA